MKDEWELQKTIKQAIDTIQPEAFAKERVLQRMNHTMSANSRQKKSVRWVKRLVPICLFAVMTTASASILVKNLRTDETEKRESALTEIGKTDLALVETIDPTECVTVGDRVWSRILYSEEQIGTTAELVTHATDETLNGCLAYRTADETQLAVMTPTGETRWYTYFGHADEQGYVIDDCFADFLQGSGIPDAESILYVTVHDPSRDVETEQDGLVSYTYYRKVISEPETIRSLYTLLTDLQRDMDGYTWACEEEAPYEGHWTLILQTQTKEIQLIFYPKISYIWGGYWLQPDTWESLQTILWEEPTA